MHNTDNSRLTDNASAPELENTAWQKRVEMMLLILAEKAELITYDRLATLAEIPAPHRIHKLTLFLELLIATDITQNNAVRASVVISKIRGLPAPGFFACLQEHGMPLPDGAEHECHKALLAALNPAFVA